MEKFVPVVVIKELSETDKILTALKNSGINTAEILAMSGFDTDPNFDAELRG